MPKCFLCVCESVPGEYGFENINRKHFSFLINHICPWRLTHESKAFVPSVEKQMPSRKKGGHRSALNLKADFVVS